MNLRPAECLIPTMEKITKYFSDFTNTQIQQFSLLENLYREWNSKINVISRKDIGSLYEKHVLHSLTIAAAFDFQPGTEIIDIGTGGGFPGIPLAIFFPDVRFHLVDSIKKKLTVADAVAAGIGLQNITTEHSRVEELKKSKSPGRLRKFDFAVSRAVAPLKDLWNWSKPILKSNAEINSENENKPGLICLKGGDLSLEIQESMTKPRLLEITDIFPEEFFRDKYLLYIHK